MAKGRWQAHLLDEIDRREEAKEVLLDTFVLLGDTMEGIKSVGYIGFLTFKEAISDGTKTSLGISCYDCLNPLGLRWWWFLSYH